MRNYAVGLLQTGELSGRSALGPAGEMLRRDFFQRDPLSCARDLIGCELNWSSCAGLIVETEAYNAIGDEACHCFVRSEEHTSELQSRRDLVCRLLLEKKKKINSN